MIKKKYLIFGIYFGGIITYNIFTICSNGSKQLLEYREKKQTFKNELASVEYGIQKNLLDNLLLSLFWPLRITFKIVPILILNLNIKEDKCTDNNKIYNNNKKVDKLKKDDVKTEEVIDFNSGHNESFNFSAGSEK